MKIAREQIAREAGKVLAVAAAALFGQVVLGALLTALLTAILGPVWPQGPSPEAVLPPLALAQLLMVLGLWAPTRFSKLPKRSLVWALFLAIFGLGVFLTHVEAAVFLVMAPGQLLWGFINGTLHALWLAWLMAMAFSTDPVAESAGNRSGEKLTGEKLKAGLALPWRALVASSVCYLILYFVAGMLIYAQIEAYYATQNIPPLPWLIVLQLARGAFYVLFVSYVLKGSTMGRSATSLAMALMFPMLAGVASLLVPNALMPDIVRYWHMLEIGISNFIFGALVGYLFWAGDSATDSLESPPASHHRLYSPTLPAE